MNRTAATLPPLPAGKLTRATIRARLRRIAEIDRQRSRHPARPD